MQSETLPGQVEDPDGPRMIALRAQHMHDLHVLNGTLKEDQLKCLNCGGDGHKSWQCPDTVCITNSTICGSCGGVGHVTRDCKVLAGQGDIGGV